MAWVLKMPLLQGLLLGSIVGSTDAAAVFSVLRTSGLKLPERLTATLEVESGSNDPMAIFLTLGLIGVISGSADSPQALLLLALAFGLAAVLGGSGFLAVYIAGIVLGSSSIVFRRGIFSFHDATAWLGLKGAVPITLATFPLMAGVPQSPTIFNAVFFVVLISAITQGPGGWSAAARSGPARRGAGDPDPAQQAPALD